MRFESPSFDLAGQGYDKRQWTSQRAELKLTERMRTTFAL